MKKILIFIILSLIYINGFTQVNQMDVRKLNVRNWIIYQGDTLGVANYHDDTLFVEQGNTIDTIPLLAIAISGDTIFAGGDTLVASGVSHWTKTGDDIENNNAGKVIMPKDSTYFSGIPDQATKVGRLLHVNQYGKIEWTSPAMLGDTIAASGGGAWTKSGSYLYPATLTDKVGIGTQSPTEILGVNGGLRLSPYREKKCAIVFCDDDGDTAVYTKLLPIFSAKGVKGNLAINSSRHSDVETSYLTWDQLREMQNTYGWEILNHSYNHENLETIYDTYGADSVRDCVANGKLQLESEHINVYNFCYPFSSEKKEVRKIIRETHRSGLGRDYVHAPDYFSLYNDYPLETYRLARIDFDGINWDSGYDPLTIQYPVDSSKNYFYYQAIIDTANKYGYNIQFMQHSRFAANDTAAFLDKDSVYADHWTITEQVLDYIIDTLGIPVYTMSEFLDTCGNLIDIGDPDPDCGWMAVDAEGNISRMKLSRGNAIVGNFAGRYSDPSINITAVGYQAADSIWMNDIDDILFRNMTAVGYKAGYHNKRGGMTTVGYEAGYNNTGGCHTSIGHTAGVLNTKNNTTFVGYQAGYHNSGEGSTLMGAGAGANNEGANATAFGYNAAKSNTKDNVNAFGAYAANGNTGTGPISVFGHWSGRSNTGYYLHAFGYYAGRNNTGTSVTAFGMSAAYNNTGNNAILIGNFSGAAANTTHNRFILMNYAANTTPLLTGDLQYNKLGIGNTSPDSALTVTGGGRFTGGLKAAESLTVTGLDSASTSYGLYYNKTTGVITYDSAGSGGVADSYWDQADDTLTTNYHVKIDSSFKAEYQNTKIGYYLPSELYDSDYGTGTFIGIDVDTVMSFYKSEVFTIDDDYSTYGHVFNGVNTDNYHDYTELYMVANSSAESTYDLRAVNLYDSTSIWSDGNEIRIDAPIIRVDTLPITNSPYFVGWDVGGNQLVAIDSADFLTSESDPVWLSDSSVYISKSQARSDINDSLVANSQGFITSTLAADLNAASYNIDNVDTLTVDNLIMTSPSAWMDQFRQRPFYYTDCFGNGAANLAPFPPGAVSSGTISTYTNDQVNHPGVVKMTSSTTNNSGHYMNTSSSTNSFAGLSGGEMFNCIAYHVRFDSTTCRIGFLDTQTSSDATDGAYFEINTSGEAKGKTASNSSRSETGTYNLSDSTWYRYNVTANADASVITFTIYSDAGASLFSETLNTNIPGSTRATGAGLVATKEANGTGSAKDLIWIDYIDIYLGALTR